MCNFNFFNLVIILPDATIMTAGDKVETVLVHGETGDSVKMGHHTVDHGARVVVVEPAQCTVTVNPIYDSCL